MKPGQPTRDEPLWHLKRAVGFFPSSFIRGNSNNLGGRTWLPVFHDGVDGNTDFAPSRQFGFWTLPSPKSLSSCQLGVPKDRHDREY